MLSFFLKRILGKKLTISVVWGLAYISYTGYLVIKDVRLNETSSSLNKPIARVARTEIDLDWGSIFGDVLEIEEAKLYDVSAELAVDRPLRIIYALRGRQRKKAGMPGGGAPGPKGRGSVDPNTLRVKVASFFLRRGELVLRREDRQVRLRVVRGVGNNIVFPLESGDFRMRIDLLVVSLKNGDGGKAEEVFPVRAEIAWKGKPELLTIRARVRDLPLEVPHTLLPKLFPAAQGSSSELSGRLNGQISLQYSPHDKPGGRWSLL